MLNSEEWNMHAKATRSIANRTLLYGDVKTSQILLEAARKMERQAGLTDVPTAASDQHVRRASRTLRLVRMTGKE
jgi:hypothetical protein